MNASFFCLQYTTSQRSPQLPLVVLCSRFCLTACEDSLLYANTYP